MVNGAPGSAWASVIGGDREQERQLLGTPAEHDDSPLTEAHLFDLASLTKLFTAVSALSLVDDGIIDLDAPVSEHLEIRSGSGAGEATLRQLLTHTAGLPADHPGWRTERRDEALMRDVLATELVAPPGQRHLYSDVGFILVGRLIECAAGRSLENLIEERVSGPLGAGTLTFRPDPRSAVATETQPHRGPVRGEVHDELAHALGMPVGHAGLFGTVDDVAAFATMILDEGAGALGKVLSQRSARLMTEASVLAEGYVQAAGLRAREHSWMGRVDALGHTGFTGTCVALSPAARRFGVLLTNRVHPSRDDADIAGIRRAFVGRICAA